MIRPRITPAPTPPFSSRGTPRRSLTLLESGRSLSPVHALTRLAGMLLHGTLVASVVVASSVQARAAAEEAAERTAQYVPPEQSPVNTPVEQRLQFVGLAAGEMPVPATDVSPTGDAGYRVTVPGEEQTFEGTETAEEEAYEEFVLSDVDVDSAVTPDPESGGPTYPEELLAARVEGVVAARFIVDSTGRVVPGSFLALESTHPAFTRAVEESMPRMKFRPAWVGPRRVPQLVVQSFAFRIAVSDTLVNDSSRRRRPPP